MPIRRGEAWGVPVERDPAVRVATSDSELVRLVNKGGGGAITVTAGDLFQTVGAPGARDEMVRVPVDLIAVATDRGDFQAVAQVLVFRSRWRGPAIALCNCSQRGRWNLAPRAHPNDGLIDIVEMDADMPLRDRWQASRRVVNGTHLPHPKIHYSRVTDRSWAFDRPMRCFVDDVDVGMVKHLDAKVIPDAFELDF